MSCSYTGPDGQKTLDVDASQIPSRDKASEGIEGFHFRIIRFFGHGQEVSDHVRPWPLLVSTGPPANRWIRVAKRTVAGTDAARDAITALHNHIDSIIQCYSSHHTHSCCACGSKQRLGIQSARCIDAGFLEDVPDVEVLTACISIAFYFCSDDPACHAHVKLKIKHVASSLNKDIPYVRTCASLKCHKTENFDGAIDDPERRFKTSGGCRLLKYCSSSCQREHWSEHKRECREMNSVRKAAKAAKEKEKQSS